MSLRSSVGVVLVTALIVLNGYWLSSVGTRRAEARSLDERLSRLTSQLGTAGSDVGSTRRLARLVELNERRRREGDSLGETPGSLSDLRERLVRAERGLELERDSLEFREEEARSVSVRVTIRGRFAAVWEYLRNLEQMKLPLAVRQMNLRREPNRTLTLSTHWLAQFPGEPMEASELLARLDELERWYQRRAATRPARDPFEPAAERAGLAGIPTPKPTGGRLIPPPTRADDSGQENRRPRLTGFITTDAGASKSGIVRAAIEFDGALQILAVGNRWEHFELTHIEPRQSVSLLDTRTGRTIELRLDP